MIDRSNKPRLKIMGFISGVLGRLRTDGPAVLAFALYEVLLPKPGFWADAGREVLVLRWLREGRLPYRDFDWSYGPLSILAYYWPHRALGMDDELMVVRHLASVYAIVGFWIAFRFFREFLKPAGAGIAAFSSWFLVVPPLYTYGHLVALILQFLALWALFRFSKSNSATSFNLLCAFLVLLALTRPHPAGMAMAVTCVLGVLSAVLFGHSRVSTRMLVSGVMCGLATGLGVVWAVSPWVRPVDIPKALWPFDPAFKDLYLASNLVPALRVRIWPFPSGSSFIDILSKPNLQFFLLGTWIEYLTFIGAAFAIVSYVASILRRRPDPNGWRVFVLALGGILADSKTMIYGAHLHLYDQALLFATFAVLAMSAWKKGTAHRTAHQPSKILISFALAAFWASPTIGAVSWHVAKRVVLVIPKHDPETGTVTRVVDSELDVSGVKGVRVPHQTARLLHDAVSSLSKIGEPGEPVALWGYHPFLELAGNRKPLFEGDFFRYMRARLDFFITTHYAPSEPPTPEQTRLLEDILSNRPAALWAACDFMIQEQAEECAGRFEELVRITHLPYRLHFRGQARLSNRLQWMILIYARQDVGTDDG